MQKRGEDDIEKKNKGEQRREPKKKTTKNRGRRD